MELPPSGGRENVRSTIRLAAADVKGGRDVGGVKSEIDVDQ
jgi:hypothetical protein